MALIHEQLTKSGHMATIDFAQYLAKLTRYLLDSYVGGRERIRVSMDVDVILPLDQAMPCGLIVQELFSNSLKHAVPEGATGEIHIEFHRRNGDHCLKYRDTGVGLPDGFGVKQTQSLGTQLISDLVAQLHGSLKYFNSDGAQFEAVFPAVRK